MLYLDDQMKLVFQFDIQKFLFDIDNLLNRFEIISLLTLFLTLIVKSEAQTIDVGILKEIPYKIFFLRNLNILLLL